MVEVCLNQGVSAHLVDDERELNPIWFNGVSVVGVTAGASAPEHLVQSLIEHVQHVYGFGAVEEVEIKDEDVKFSLPGELTRGLTQISSPPLPM
jgi:4-hydroxy-3-methylbut-2-en-1-yl diphosphate reductase